MMLLPTSAKRLIELHDCQLLHQPNLRQIKLRLEEVAIRIQCIELGIYSSPITEVCQPQTVLQRGHECCLLFAPFPNALVCNQSIGDLGEGGLNRLLVSNQCAFPASLRQSDTGSNAAARI